MRRPAALWLLLVCGCMPPMSLTRATVLAPAEARIAGTMELSILTPEAPPEEKVPVPWAHVGGGYHQGVADGVEVGGRGWVFGIPDFWSFGVSGDTKLQIARSGNPRDGSDVAAGLSLVYQQVRFGGTPWHQVGAIVPLFIGHNYGRHQLVWGPHVGCHIWTGMGQNTIVFPTFGGSVGFAWRLGQRFDLMPQMDLFYTPIGAGGEVRSESYGGSWGLQVGVAASFGR